MRGRRTWLTAVLGVVVLVLGVLVLRSPRAEAEIGWFSYSGPPAPEVLDDRVAWNVVRAVGALLVLLGLLVWAQLLGVLAGRRNGPVAARHAGGVLVLGAVLVLGGLAAFLALGRIDQGEEVITISKFVGSSHLVPGPDVWTQDQLDAALVVATGLVVAAVGRGLRVARKG